MWLGASRAVTRSSLSLQEELSGLGVIIGAVNELGRASYDRRWVLGTVAESQRCFRA
jgi:hypothetical protein